MATTPSKAKGSKAGGKGKRDRANWGAAEHPRYCRNGRCKSTRSTVEDTKQFKFPDRTVRYRLCKACNQRYSTIELH